MSRPLKDRQLLWPWFIAASIAVVAIVPQLDGPYGTAEVLLAALGGIWAFAFFLHNSHKEDARFMKELLGYFNTRYDQINDNLQSHLQRPGDLTPEQELAFVNYFNLCAEEWVFRKLGYVYDEVWRSWRNGMRQYAGDPRVVSLWKREKETNSHYGFDFLDGEL